MPPKLARPPKKGTKADLEAKAKKVSEQSSNDNRSHHCPEIKASDTISFSFLG